MSNGLIEGFSKLSTPGRDSTTYMVQMLQSEAYATKYRVIVINPSERFPFA
jgi:hypothetical protein